jgi:hypothetical protein
MGALMLERHSVKVGPSIATRKLAGRAAVEPDSKRELSIVGGAR